MQHVTKERLRAAGRDLVFRVFTAGGVVVGLLYGLNNPPTPNPAPKCTTPQCAGDQVSSTLSTTIWAYLGPVLICALIGAALALLLCVTALRPRRADGSAQPLSATVNGRWMSARFDGRCAACRREIHRGDAIFHSRSPRQTLCSSCGGA